MYKLRRLIVLTPILLFLSLQAKGATLTAYIANNPGNTGCTGENVTLNDSSAYNGSQTLSYKWYFGDGTTATGSSQQKKYASAGTYTVSLVVESPSESLKDSVTKSITVYAKPPVDFSVSGPQCVGSELVFKNTTSLPSGTSISSVLWKWGDGNSTTLITSEYYYIYSSTGTYNVVLYVTTDKGCTDSIQKTITINPKPKAVMTITARCEDSTSELSAASSTGPIAGYKWFFPDGTTQTGTTVQKKFAGPGIYSVKLIAENSGPGCDDSISRNVVVGDNPSINIWLKNTCNDSILTVLDSSRSSYGSLAYWEWDWGDGSAKTIYTQKDDTVTHPYNNPGKYTITLTVKTEKGCASTITRQVEMYPLPEANFSFKNTCEDSAVTFTDMSTATASAPITDWVWYFGDSTNGMPSMSFDQHPTHVYQEDTTYWVSLVTYSKFGCKDSIAKKIRIYPSPTSKFTFTSKCEKEIVDFVDFSTVPNDTAVAWHWDFGDGKATSTTKDAKHIFDTAGVYYVRHAAFSRLGCADTAVVQVNIYEPPVPDFVYEKNCERDTVKFFDSSTIPAPFTIVDWQWNFGDGFGAAGKTAKHIYANSGTYNVVLTVTSDKGCSKSILKKVNIVEAPVANFNNTPTCFGRSTNFTSTSTYSGTITDNVWDFGDGTPLANGKNVSHTYTSKGVYYVKLTSISDIGCQDDIIKQVSVSDVPDAGYTFKNVCNDSGVSFTDTSTIAAGNITGWSWDFGDGNTGSGQKPTHKYANPGTYNVKLVVTSATGCQDSVIHQVQTYAAPEADFDYVTHCKDSLIYFYDKSKMPVGGAGGYFWDFGDGQTSTSQHPTHNFFIGGNYNVKLTAISSKGCRDEKIIPMQVYPLPKVDFFSADACAMSPYKFFDNSSVTSGSNVSWLWDFGDGDTSSLKDPEHIYTDSGLFTVKLVVMTDKGCKDSVEQVIEVNQIPNVDFVYTGACLGEVFNFTDSSTVKGGIDRWSWDFGDGGKRSNQNPSYEYLDTGVYTVTLIAYSSYGCSDTVRKQVRVFPLPTAGFKSNTVCEGQVTILEDTSTSSGGNKIIERLWLFGDSTFTRTSSATVAHKYPDGGSYNVSLEVVTENGCRSTSTGTVTVLQAPQAAFVHDPNPATMLNPEIKFEDRSVGAIKWWWDFGDGFEDSTQNPVHMYSDTGDYQVIMAVQNSLGCVDTIYYTLRINDKYTLFAPNIITVNDDDVNDVWMARGEGIKQYEVFIYDRWGGLVFHSTDINEPWNGEFQNTGVRVPEGVYVYWIKLVEYSNVEWKTHQGSILLLR